MVAEPTATNGYTDTVLSEAIERYPVADAAGELPTDERGNANSAWTPTYDLNSAAAEVWMEKAAALASVYDFAADGGDYKRSQAMQHAQGMVAYYRARRAARSVRLTAEMNPVSAQDWIGNLAEVLDD